MWPRYGSFPGFNPIVELSLSFHNLVVGANGQRQAMFLENVSGLADRILVLHKGEIREIGTHQELLAQRGIYYRLYLLQYKDQEAERREMPHPSLTVNV